MPETVLQYALSLYTVTRQLYTVTFDVDAASLAVAPNLTSVPNPQLPLFVTATTLSYAPSLTALAIGENFLHYSSGFPGPGSVLVPSPTTDTLSGTTPLAAQGPGGNAVPLLGTFSFNPSQNPFTAQTLTVSALPANLFVYSGQSYANLLTGTGDATFVEQGGSVSGVTIASGGVAVDNGGSVVSAGIVAGGNAFVQAGSDVFATVGAGGMLTVSGGTDSAATVAGEAAVYGGTVTGATVQAGGLLVQLGGVVSAAKVSGNMTQLGGTASSTLIQTGGAVFVKGGVDSAAAVTSGGTLFVSGGLDSGAIIGSGGIAFVTGSGVVSGASVFNGGVLQIQAGGTASSTVLNNGGAIDLHDVSYATASGFTFDGSTDTISFLAGGVAQSVSLGGSYTVPVFQYSADSGGGVLITAGPLAAHAV